jgi:hypothetical protein
VTWQYLMCVGNDFFPVYCVGDLSHENLPTFTLLLCGGRRKGWDLEFPASMLVLFSLHSVQTLWGPWELDNSNTPYLEKNKHMLRSSPSSYKTWLGQCYKWKPIYLCPRFSLTSPMSTLPIAYSGSPVMSGFTLLSSSRNLGMDSQVQMESSWPPWSFLLENGGLPIPASMLPMCEGGWTWGWSAIQARNP